MKTDYYEFSIKYTTSLTPHINDLKKTKGNYFKSYKIIATVDKEVVTFYALRVYEKISEAGQIISEVSLNTPSNFNGLIHLVDNENVIVFAKKMNNGIELIKDYYAKVFKELDPLKSRERYVCATVVTYHMKDWYKLYELEGITYKEYLSTEYLGYSREQICAYEYLPDYGGSMNNEGGGGGPSAGAGTYKKNCDSTTNSKSKYFSRASEGCAVIVTEEDVECEKGYTIDANGKCVLDLTQIFNNLTDPCAKSIFTELENGLFKDHPLKPEVQVPNTGILNFSESTLKLFNDSDNTHLIIQNGTTNGSNASTTGATITISDNYLANATKLSIARTMIHESVHAYINALYSNVVSFNSFTFRDKIEKYAVDKGYVIGTNNFHHNFMGQYVNAMAYSLFEWDKRYGSGGNLGWDYYRSMSFGGMFQVDTNGNIVSETDSFKAIEPVSDKRKDIAKKVVNELKGNNDAKGTKC